MKSVTKSLQGLPCAKAFSRHIGKRPPALFDKDRLLGNVNPGILFRVRHNGLNAFSIAVNKAVVYTVDLRHYVPAKERKMIVFGLYDRLRTLLKVASPFIDIAVVECRIFGINTELKDPVDGFGQAVAGFPLHSPKLRFYKRRSLHEYGTVVKL